MYKVTGTVKGVLVAPVAETLMLPERLRGRYPLNPSGGWMPEGLNDTLSEVGAVPEVDPSLIQGVLAAVHASVPAPRLEIFSAWLGDQVCLRG
jgi:hypothetical protein